MTGRYSVVPGCLFLVDWRSFCGGWGFRATNKLVLLARGYSLGFVGIYLLCSLVYIPLGPLKPDSLLNIAVVFDIILGFHVLVSEAIDDKPEVGQAFPKHGDYKSPTQHRGGP